MAVELPPLRQCFDATAPHSPLQEVAAGVFAGVCDALASHPIDQVKTQFHINSSGHNGTVLAALRSQAKASGVGTLYRGVAASCAKPQALCMYTGNEWAKRLVAGPSGELSNASAYVAGALTGYVESASVTPFEVVKVRMQSLDHLGRYTSSLHCLRMVVREEGAMALYTGFWASCWRNCTFNGVMMGIVFSARPSWPTTVTPSSAVALDVCLGMGAAFVATIFKMPFDVAKSRLQNQPPPPPGAAPPKYVHTLQTCATIMREEGAPALYRGFSPTVMRMVVGQGVAYAAFEFALSRMRGGGGARDDPSGM